MRDATTAMGDSDMLLWTWGSYIAPDCPIPNAGYGSIPAYSGGLSSKSTALLTRLIDRVTKHRGKSVNMAGRGDVLDFVKSIGVAAPAH
jgi:hypothetical protein